MRIQNSQLVAAKVSRLKVSKLDSGERRENSPDISMGFFNWECTSSIPPRSATHWCVRPRSPRNARMGRKSGLFAHWISSPDSHCADLEVEIAESLRPCPRIFPFCGDYRRRLV